MMRKYKCGSCGYTFDKGLKLIDRYDDEYDVCPQCRDDCFGYNTVEQPSKNGASFDLIGGAFIF